MTEYTKSIPHWMNIALGEIGIAEIPGPANNQRILEYHATTLLGAKDDFVPWCSAFMCWVFECSRFKSTKNAAARSWLNWGLKLDSPEFGCIAVLQRGQNPNQGHVGFVVDQDSQNLYLLGGNQEDRVSIRKFPKSSVLAYRWPDTNQMQEI